VVALGLLVVMPAAALQEMVAQVWQAQLLVHRLLVAVAVVGVLQVELMELAVLVVEVMQP
jgi:hypothetical protein